MIATNSFHQTSECAPWPSFQPDSCHHGNHGRDLTTHVKMVCSNLEGNNPNQEPKVINHRSVDDGWLFLVEPGHVELEHVFH